VAAQVKLTAVITQPRLKRTRLLGWHSLVLREELVEESSEEGRSSSERRGESGPGDVDLLDRQDTRFVRVHGGLSHRMKEASTSSSGSSSSSRFSATEGLECGPVSSSLSSMLNLGISGSTVLAPQSSEGRHTADAEAALVDVSASIIECCCCKYYMWHYNIAQI
jgi:hypothetical protein